VALVDVLCIALGFLLRLQAGANLGQITLSHWIILMTFLLALFLGFAKRMDDVFLHEQEGVIMRRASASYNQIFLSSAMVMLASVSVVCYILYTVSEDVVAVHHTDKLYLTAVWVILGFLRYMQLTFVERSSGNPTQVLLRDVFLRWVVAGWLVSLFVIMYVMEG